VAIRDVIPEVRWGRLDGAEIWADREPEDRRLDAAQVLPAADLAETVMSPEARPERAPEALYKPDEAQSAV